MPSRNYQRRFVHASIWALITAASVAVTACASHPAPGAVSRPAAALRARDAAPLYPLTTGLRWDYLLRQRQENGTVRERPMAMGVARAAEIAPGLVEAVLERGYEGWSPPATRARASADQVVLSRLADPAPPEGPSLTILRLPANAGDRWPGRPLTGGHQETVVVRGEEEVAVPAGTFHATHVDHELAYANGDGDVLSYWYAPGVGCVRMIERTTIYVGDKPMKLAVEGVLTKLTRDGWPQASAAPALEATAEPLIRLLPRRIR